MADSKISALTANTAPASADVFPHVDVSDTSEAATGTDKKITWGDIAGNLALAGTAASIPAANSVPAGTFYLTTDATPIQLSRSNGSAWVLIGGDTGYGKGYVRVGTGTGAATFQGPGSDGQILVADSSVTNGVDWKGIATGMGNLDTPIQGTQTSTATGAINTWYAVRVSVSTPTTWPGIRVVTGATANGNLRAALYDLAGTTKLADRTSDVAQGGAGNFTTIAFDSNYQAMPGSYYALIWASSATATFLMGRCLSPGSTGTNATTTPANVGSPTFSATAARPLFSLYT